MSSKIAILVDALDECEQREEVLRFLQKLDVEKFGVNILVTCREDADFGSPVDLYERLRMEDCRCEVDKDIKSYITHRLATDDHLKKLPQAIKNEIKDSLIERSAGMFRWAQCQMDELSHLRSVKAIRTSLSHLPPTLNAIYRTILHRVQRHDIELLRKALLWTALSVYPMNVTEISDAIAIEANMCSLSEVEDSRILDFNDILRLGNGLLTLDSTGHVKLAHLSVLDYLLSADIKCDPEVGAFWIDSKEARGEMAVSCLTYLRLQDLAIGPVESLTIWEQRLASLPLLRHAAKGWSYYHRQAGSNEDLDRIVQDFFSTNSRSTFMSWVQILNSSWIFKAYEFPRHATPLYYASSFGLDRVVGELLQSGADLNSPGSRFGGTALHGATLREHIAIMRLLLEAGANPSQADFNQVTPLHTATRIGNAEVIRLLLEYGAAKDAPDTLGQTPCDWALQSGKEASQLLLLGMKSHECVPAPPETGSPVYQRPSAYFPALAVAQGIAIGSPSCHSKTLRATNI
ncbi:hypothetical protein IQ06DRAFT_220549 [Phaeosphaeriaceae sp. SRC1lsM3a]|nr:hypothetical protein IQ06DRAFT_220549 [Stagonospora sp. SRC1lsM3a]